MASWRAVQSRLQWCCIWVSRLQVPPLVSTRLFFFASINCAQLAGFYSCACHKWIQLFDNFFVFFLQFSNLATPASPPFLVYLDIGFKIFLNNAFVLLYLRLIASACHVLFSTGSRAIKNNHTLIHQACHSSEPAVPTQIKQDVGMAAHNWAIIMFVISI